MKANGNEKITETVAATFLREFLKKILTGRTKDAELTVEELGVCQA